jgi:phenylalanyl-tRNA synthetase beta chain
MQVSEAWLREWSNPAVDTASLVDQLTMAGLEVDAVEPVAAAFNGVVVAEVLSMEQHPNADKLRICQVNVGQQQPLQIVCGASNVRPGLKIPAALDGAVLPGDFKIKPSKLRGEVSLGMLCSAKELGLVTQAEGLMELPADAPVGVDIRDYLSLNDNSIELGLTPNRADCLSVRGLAREVALLNQLPFTDYAMPEVAVNTAETVAVHVDDSDACPRYLGRLIQGINPQAASPLWLQERLRRSGIRSVSAVVDITNYVLLELGQPLHAFDADTLAAPVVVRRSVAGETLVLLNDQTLTLEADSLVIADQRHALALAGVMGGKSSAVSDETVNIFLECAFFSPISIAGKARQYGLHTDSSHRFERGVDSQLQHLAIERASQLILEIAGGEAGPITSIVCEAALPAPTAIVLNRATIQQLLAIEYDDAAVEAVFHGLGMQVTAIDGGWSVVPPSFRFDIAIEADLIEELARVYGYNNLPSSSLMMPTPLGKAPEAVLPLARLQDCLVDRGYQEAITYSFVDEAIQAALAPNVAVVRIQNPISSELAVMRTTLWCGLVNAALYNLNRQQTRMRLFETGLRFTQSDTGLQQDNVLAGLALGSVNDGQWAEKPRPVDFFDVKADVEALFYLAAQTVVFEAAEHPALHPGQTAALIDSQGQRVGLMGMLHPSLEKQLGFDSPVFLFEIEQKALQARQLPRFQPLSKFPSVHRDLALIVDENLAASAILDCIASCNEAAIRDVQLFDVYRGPGVADGFKSIALTINLQSFDGTLAETQIDAIFINVLDTLSAQLNAKLRE